MARYSTTFISNHYRFPLGGVDARSLPGIFFARVLSGGVSDKASCCRRTSCVRLISAAEGKHPARCIGPKLADNVRHFFGTSNSADSVCRRCRTISGGFPGVLISNPSCICHYPFQYPIHSTLPICRLIFILLSGDVLGSSTAVDSFRVDFIAQASSCPVYVRFINGLSRLSPL